MLRIKDPEWLMELRAKFLEGRPARIDIKDAMKMTEMARTCYMLTPGHDGEIELLRLWIKHASGENSYTRPSMVPNTGYAKLSIVAARKRVIEISALISEAPGPSRPRVRLGKKLIDLLFTFNTVDEFVFIVDALGSMHAMRNQWQIAGDDGLQDA